MWRVLIILAALSSASVVTGCGCEFFGNCPPPPIVDPPPPPGLAWETTIASAQGGNQVTWVVSCNGPCRQLRAQLTTSSGDADLYANEDDPPSLSSYHCPDCSMCEAVTAGLGDTCTNMATQSGGRLVGNHHQHHG